MKWSVMLRGEKTIFINDFVFLVTTIIVVVHLIPSPSITLLITS